jgi:signal peptidase I
MNEAPPKTPPKRKFLRRLFRAIERVLAVFGALVILYYAFFNYSEVVSASMSPTLEGSISKHDYVLTEKISYHIRNPRRWEVITFLGEDGTQIMKRVVGLPGEKVQMLSKGRIFIDGREIPPPPELDFLHYFPFGQLTDGHAVDCGDGFFVLGDFSRDSDDSRFRGPIRPKYLLGRAWIIVRPWDRSGFIH